MEYQVTLPDYNHVIGSKHKLISSVTGKMKVIKSRGLNSGAVIYSGPTYIAIRSAKHSGLSAGHHLRDIKRASSFQNLMTVSNVSIPEKVMIVTIDGGPVDNPRCSSTPNCAIEYVCEHKLDAYFVATKAPGRIAFNRLERRMSSLSRELRGVILPHNHFGSHLSYNNQTIDKEMELKSFEHAGEIHAELWSTLELMVILSLLNL